MSTPDMPTVEMNWIDVAPSVDALPVDPGLPLPVSCFVAGTGLYVMETPGEWTNVFTLTSEPTPDTEPDHLGDALWNMSPSARYLHVRRSGRRAMEPSPEVAKLLAGLHPHNAETITEQEPTA